MKLSRGNFTIFLQTLLLFVLPLLFFHTGENRFEYPKFAAFVVGTEIIVIMFIVVITVINKSEQNIDFPLNRLTILILLFGIVTLIADLIGLDPKVSLLGSV